jgi:hypothetical protein
MRRSIILGLAPALAFAAVLASSREARAGLIVGAEYGAGQQIDGPANAKSAYGLVGTLGYRLGLGPVFLQPEAQASYMTFPTTLDTHEHLWRVQGGGRFGLGGMFQPQIYGHTGIAWQGMDVFNNGKAFDVGFALAFKLIPLVSFGGQVGYNVATFERLQLTTQWVSYGAHVAVEF